MAAIESMLDELLAREGGYVDHPNDRGGPTNYGITEYIARAHGYKGDMRSLPKGTAVTIYRTLYWLNPSFDHVAVRMPKVAAELFDTGVNMGPATASKFLQRALNVLNRGTTDYPDLVPDGQIGRMTLYAIEQLKAKRGTLAETVLLRALEGLQVCRYTELAEKDKRQESFMFGWLANRVGG